MSFSIATDQPRPLAPIAIAQAAFAGGALDLAYAFIRGGLAGAPPGRILQSIASGWLGPSAYGAGTASAALGVATHFGIAAVMATALAVVFAARPALAGRPLWLGAAYGGLLYAVMYGLVLPIRWPALYPRFEGPGSVADILIHMAVGVVFALLLTRRSDP